MPGSVGVVSALRQMVTGVLAEKVAMAVSAKRVPQLERDIAALDGREFGEELGRRPGEDHARRLSTDALPTRLARSRR